MYFIIFGIWSYSSWEPWSWFCNVGFIFIWREGLIIITCSLPVTLRGLDFMLSCFMDLFLMDEIVLILKSYYILRFLPLVSHIIFFPAEGRQLKCKVGGNPLWRWGLMFQNVVYTLYQIFLFMVLCLQSEEYMDLETRGWKQEWPHLHHSQWPTEFCCLCSAGLEVLDTARVRLNYKLWVPSGHFELLAAKDHQVNRVTT